MNAIKVSTDTKLHRPWQGTLLAWLSVIETVFTLMTFLFLLKLAYEGFKAGEMGVMIGIFGIIFLGFMLWAEIVCLKSPYYLKKVK